MIKWLRSRGVWFWSISITVISVGALFLGSQVAHDRGQTVDWYTGFGQWLGALGSLIAAAAALYIATRDRKERAQDRIADHRAQAKLVMVEREYQIENPEPGRARPYYCATVTNNSGQPILDIAPRSAKLLEYRNATPELEGGADLLKPAGTVRFEARFRLPDGTYVPGPVEPDIPDQRTKNWHFDAVGLEYWVRFTDVHGNLWSKSTEHQLLRLGTADD